MTTLGSFDDLLARLEVLEPGPIMLEVLRDAYDRAERASAEECALWVEPLLEFGQGTAAQRDLIQRWGDAELEPEDLLAELDALRAIVLQRASEASRDFGTPKFWVLVGQLATESRVIEIPARMLVREFRIWISDGFQPGLCEYHQQAMRKAVPVERLQIGNQLILANDVDRTSVSLWLQEALADAYALEPATFRTWLAWLEDEGPHNEIVESILARYRTLLGAFQEASNLPEAVSRALAAQRLDLPLLEEALQAIASGSAGSFSIPGHLVLAALKRTRDLARPLIPHELRLVLCPEAYRLILSAQQLEQLSPLGPTAACALYCLALEAQLREVLGKQSPKVMTAVSSGGLRMLSRLVSGRHVSDLPGVRVTNAPPELAQSIEEAAHIRNRVQHPHPPVGMQELERLRAMVFGIGRASVLPGLARLRCSG